MRMCHLLESLSREAYEFSVSIVSEIRIKHSYNTEVSGKAMESYLKNSKRRWHPSSFKISSKTTGWLKKRWVRIQTNSLLENWKNNLAKRNHPSVV